MQAFLLDLEKSNFVSDSTWLKKLGFLADIFDFQNELNKSLQGKKVDVFTIHDSLRGFLGMIGLW
jgi:zinc finger BED domain-containing protein 5/7/8/9